MRTLANFNTLPSLFDSFFETAERPVAQGHFTPDIDIKKNENEYRVTAVLPGVKKEDLNISVEDGYLKLSGKFEKEEAKDYENVHRETYSYAEFSRSLKINQERFDTEKVAAKLENGILEITLPVSEKAKPKQIDVKIS